jgi:hypothetical protein
MPTFDNLNLGATPVGPSNSFIWRQWVDSFPGFPGLFPLLETSSAIIDSTASLAIDNTQTGINRNIITATVPNGNDANDTAVARVLYPQFLPPGQEGRLRLHLTMPASFPLTGNSTFALGLTAGGIEVIDLYLTSARVLNVFSTAGTLNSTALNLSSGQTLALSTSYTIEIAWKQNSNLTVFLNGAQVINQVCAGAAGTALLSELRLGIDHYDPAVLTDPGWTAVVFGAQLGASSTVALNDPVFLATSGFNEALTFSSTQLRVQSSPRIQAAFTSALSFSTTFEVIKNVRATFNGNLSFAVTQLSLANVFQRIQAAFNISSSFSVSHLSGALAPRLFFLEKENGLRALQNEFDDFVRSDGAIHYDIRAFHNDDITVPFTMLDMEFWNVDHFQGVTIDNLTNRHSVVGRQFRDRLNSDLDGLAMSALDQFTMFQWDFVTLSIGNENWSTNADVTVGKDSTYRYSNTLAAVVHPSQVQTITSSYSDDILTHFNEPGETYFIEFVLRNFPAQSASSHLDLANSFIDFSSSQTYDPAHTDTFAFNASLNDLTFGGDTFWKIDRNSLVRADLSQLQAIRFRLASIGASNITIKIQAMRLIPSSRYVFRETDLDTKRNTLTRDIPQAGGTEPTTTFGQVFFNNARPRNGVFQYRINSGHNPTSPNYNILNALLRYDQTAKSWLQVQLKANNTESRMEISENTASIGSNPAVKTVLFTTTATTNILSQETDYLLQVSINGSRVKGDLFTLNGSFKGSLVYSTGWQTTSINRRGFVGYDFQPYNYDFSMDWVRAQNAVFGAHTEKPFPSVTPLKGVHLNVINSGPIQMIDPAIAVAIGDATIAPAPVGHPSAPSTLVQRLGNQWIGGIFLPTRSMIGDSQQVSVAVSIFPVGAIQGQWVAALLDRYGSVNWIADFSALIHDQWNDVQINLPPDMLAEQYSLYVHQTGFIPSTYYIDNLCLNHNSIGWQASADNGSNWRQALASINDKFTAVSFDHPGTELILQAVGYDNNAWISELRAEPFYEYTGHKT